MGDSQPFVGPPQQYRLTVVLGHFRAVRAAEGAGDCVTAHHPVTEALTNQAISAGVAGRRRVRRLPR